MSSTKELKKIKAIFILEIIGRPAEHLKKTLEDLIKKIDEEKGVKVINHKIHDTIELKEQEKISPEKKLHTTFSEIEIEVENMLQLAILMFKYMPANIEVIEPENINLSNNGWSDILSEITRRLHGYDSVARTLQMQNAQMQKKFREMLAKDKDK